jgi:WD40 repeat protein
MSSYSKTERFLAKLLEEFPIVRQFSKYLYQRLMYVFHYSFSNLVLSDGYTLIDPFLEIKGETFFGYYDKPSINMQGDILTHRVDKNVCAIYVKTLAGELIKISNTNAWNWQQGAMATWLDDEHIAYNDIVDDMVVCCIYSLEQKKVIHKHKYAMQCYSPVNKFYVSIDYKKLNSLRPEYGYQDLIVNEYDKDEGVRIVDIHSGKCIFNLTLSEIITFLKLDDPIDNAKVNHCQFSPDGRLILFMYRAYRNDGKYSYLLVWDYSNGKLIKLMANRVVSHYSWVDNNEIIVWGRGEVETGYHTVNLNGRCGFVKTRDPLLFGDGHPSVCSRTKAILTDTYPNKARMSSLFIIDNKNEERVVQLKQPWKFSGHARVDLHPRFNEDCNLITLDSGHSGDRRQYILDRCL